MDTTYDWLRTSCLVTSSLVTITANLFLLFIFCKRRSLRTVPNRFIINLLITNLLSCSLLVPLLLIDGHGGNSLELIDDLALLGNDAAILPLSANPLVLCEFARISTNFVCTLSILSILLIGINQYFGVIHSLRYHVYINRWRSMLLIVGAWLIAVVCAGIGGATRSDANLWRFCTPDTRPQRHLELVYAICYFIVVIVGGFVAISAIYWFIYDAAHANSERMRRSHECERTRTLPKVRSAPAFVNCTRTLPPDGVARAHSFLGALRHKLSNASLFRYREETRAAKISVLIIILVLICYVPYGVRMILDACAMHSNLFDRVAIALLIGSNVLSPFLFGYRNKRVKREIARLFRRDAAPLGEPVRRATDGRYRKCTFMTVAGCVVGGEARGSFSSASTQTSNEE